MDPHRTNMDPWYLNYYGSQCYQDQDQGSPSPSYYYSQIAAQQQYFLQFPSRQTGADSQHMLPHTLNTTSTSVTSIEAAEDQTTAAAIGSTENTIYNWNLSLKKCEQDYENKKLVITKFSLFLQTRNSNFRLSANRADALVIVTKAHGDLNCLDMNWYGNSLIHINLPPLYQIQKHERCGNSTSRKLTYKFWTGTHMFLESNVDQLWRGRVHRDVWKCWSFSLNSCLNGNKSIAADIN